MSRSGIIQFLSFFVYLIVQVFLFKTLYLYHTAFCFLYIGFILFLPIEINPLVLMLSGFAIGFCVDIFYDSLGIHASATILIAFLRNYWLGAIAPQGGYDAGGGPTLAANGVQWFLVYTIPMVFLHHFVLFFVEAGGFSIFWYTMLKIIGSLMFTMLMIVLIQFLSGDRRKS